MAHTFLNPASQFRSGCELDGGTAAGVERRLSAFGRTNVLDLSLEISVTDCTGSHCTGVTVPVIVIRTVIVH